jgi:hypothetical protein
MIACTMSMEVSLFLFSFNFFKEVEYSLF